MYAGRQLTNLATELQRQENVKRDFVADTRKLRLAVAGKAPQINIGSDAFPLNQFATRQIGERVGIPAKYVDKMLQELPDLFASNVNAWFDAKPERRMVRTLDGRARAFLSDRYRTIDNWDVASATLPLLSEEPDMRVVSCEVTERRMYLKAVFPKIEGEVKKGDLVQSGVVISNSEIGAGSIKVEPLVFRLVCLNGMVVPEYSQRRNHVGKSDWFGAESEDQLEIYRNETIVASDKAFLMRIQDSVRAALTDATFQKVLTKMRAASEDQIAAPVQDVIEVTKTRFALSEAESGNVLNHLIKGGDISRWGLINAITAASKDVQDYDRATDLERLGGEILELPQGDWRKIAEAVPVKPMALAA